MTAQYYCIIWYSCNHKSDKEETSSPAKLCVRFSLVLRVKNRKKKKKLEIERVHETFSMWSLRDCGNWCRLMFAEVCSSKGTYSKLEFYREVIIAYLVEERTVKLNGRYCVPSVNTRGFFMFRLWGKNSYRKLGLEQLLKFLISRGTAIPREIENERYCSYRYLLHTVF